MAHAVEIPGGQGLSPRAGRRMEPCAGKSSIPGGKARREPCVL
ncbi:hypothetical protein DVDV_1512 [Desulfovibrio sp. DV]|nr:hypothetical protein DVDV_1512 [Desulfovibrio sp. DV]